MHLPPLKSLESPLPSPPSGPHITPPACLPLLLVPVDSEPADSPSRSTLRSSAPFLQTPPPPLPDPSPPAPRTVRAHKHPAYNQLPLHSMPSAAALPPHSTEQYPPLMSSKVIAAVHTSAH